MKIYKVKNYDQMSQRAADVIAAQVLLNAKSVLGLATGTTPIGLYENLIALNKQGKIDFSDIKTVNLDEYEGLEKSHNQSYSYFMHKYLFDHININAKNINLPDGMAKDHEKECKRYDGVIESFGGVDLQLLGLGHNGHIGFNEPDDQFIANTHRVELTQSTINANARLFADAADVPKYAYTMGMKTILQAKLILLIVSGKEKAGILNEALFGPISPEVPASLLQLHSNVIVIADDDAAAKL